MLTPKKPPIFHGRQTELASILRSIKSSLQSGQPARIAIRGSGGLGKTTLALSVLYHEETVAQFGDRVFFVSCEGKDSVSLLVNSIIRSLKAPQSSSKPLSQLEGFLKLLSQPMFIVLDNFETPWLTDDQDSIKKVLTLLDSTPSLTILVTTRVAALSQGVCWTKPFFPVLGPVNLEAAKSIFADVAGEEAIQTSEDELGNSKLDELLQLVDMVPLAVTLLASAAQAGESIPRLLHSWEKERTAMLSDGSTSKDRNIEASIKISLQCKPVTSEPTCLRLLSLICLLPDGAERDKLEEMSKIENADPAIRGLKSVSLVYEEHSRIKVLSPIRGFVLSRKEYPLDGEDRAAVIRYYIILAQKGNCEPGDDKFISTCDMLQPEAGNLYSILSLAISDGVPSSDLGWAVSYYTAFLCAIGTSADLLQQLLSKEGWDKDFEPELQAGVINYLGVAYANLHQYDKAMEQCKKARRFALDNGATLQAVLSLRNIGTVYRHLIKREESLSTFRQALKEADDVGTDRGKRLVCDISEQIGTVLSALGRDAEVVEHQQPLLAQLQADFPDERLLIANVLLNLAMANCKLGNFEKALSHAEDCYSRYKQFGYVRGEGNALWCLGFTLLSNEDYEGAVNLLRKSISKLAVVGEVPMLPVVYSCLGLAYGSLRKPDEIRDAFNHAIRLNKELGNSEEEAICLQNMGNSLSECMDPECVRYLMEAREAFLKLGNKQEAAACLKKVGVSRYVCEVGSMEEISQIFKKAAKELLEIGDLFEASWACYLEGACCDSLLDVSAAIKPYETAVKGFREVGNEKLERMAQETLDKARLDLTYQPSAPVAISSEGGSASGDDVVERVAQLKMSKP